MNTLRVSYRISFLGGEWRGNVDACVSDILDILKNRQIQLIYAFNYVILYYCVVYPIVAIETIMTSYKFREGRKL